MEDVEHACMARGPAVDCASKQAPASVQSHGSQSKLTSGTGNYADTQGLSKQNDPCFESSTSATLPRMGVAGQGSGSKPRGLHDGCLPACTQPLVIDPGYKQNACLHVPVD
jgi:hypothetical protein